METTDKSSQAISWIRNNLLFMIIFILLIFFINNKLDRFESLIYESIVLPKVSLDFQNKSGVARIKTSFTDILIASDGSRKRDNGYELKLKVINPSSIYLHNINTEFRHIDSGKSATCNDVNIIVRPGSSKVLTCFISDLSDSELDSIEVGVDFEQMSSR